jgi:hypothetical protein
MNNPDDWTDSNYGFEIPVILSKPITCTLFVYFLFGQQVIPLESKPKVWDLGSNDD